MYRGERRIVEMRRLVGGMRLKDDKVGQHYILRSTAYSERFPLWSATKKLGFNRNKGQFKTYTKASCKLEALLVATTFSGRCLTQ